MTGGVAGKKGQDGDRLGTVFEAAPERSQMVADALFLIVAEPNAMPFSLPHRCHVDSPKSGDAQGYQKPS